MEFVHVTWRNIVLDGVGKKFRRLERQRHAGAFFPISIELIVCRETSCSSTNLA